MYGIGHFASLLLAHLGPLRWHERHSTRCRQFSTLGAPDLKRLPVSVSTTAFALFSSPSTYVPSTVLKFSRRLTMHYLNHALKIAWKANRAFRPIVTVNLFTPLPTGVRAICAARWVGYPTSSIQSVDEWGSNLSTPWMFHCLFKGPLPKRKILLSF
jgi:hypothetical protein